MTNATVKESDMKMSTRQNLMWLEVLKHSSNSASSWHVSQNRSTLDVTGSLTLPLSTMSNPMRVFVSIRATGTYFLELHTGRDAVKSVTDITLSELESLTRFPVLAESH
jgi:hypothetical protein